MLTISTAHIDTETAEKLKHCCNTSNDSTCDSCIAVYAKGEFGWYIYVNGDYDDLESNCLNNIIDHCRDNNIDIVCLDSDGVKISELPVYEWE